jgi:hypothetical protein
MIQATTVTNEQIVEVNSAFRESLIGHLKIDVLRRFITVPLQAERGTQVQIFTYGDSDNVVVPLGEYADYLNVTEQNVVSQAKILGAGCAILYNALLKNAQSTRFHNVAVDLLDGNLKFNHVMNAEPSVSDPANLIPGWISFRFFFGSCNVATTLKSGGTLAAVETRRGAYAY